MRTLLGLVLLLAASTANAWELGHTLLTITDPARPGHEIPADVYDPALTVGESVPLAPPPAGGFPVFAFGHGFLLPVSTYAYLWQGLVPAGRVLVLPRTGGELFPDHEDFALDLARVAAALLEAGADPGSPFYGGLAARSGVGGHSMGGGASLLAAAADPALDCLASLAAAETNPSAIAAAAQVEAPALLLAGSLDCVTPLAEHQQPMFDALAGDCHALAVLAGASHCQFAGSSTVCQLGEIGCVSPLIGRAEQQAQTLALLAPWLDWQLAGAPGARDRFFAVLDSLPDLQSTLDCAPTAVAAAPSGLGLGLSGPRGALAADEARLALTLPVDAQVSAAVYDVSGRLAAHLAAGALPAGEHALVWDLRAQGRPVATGVYFVRVRVDGAQLGHRLLVVR
jgi:dienelactone hydrolase